MRALLFFSILFCFPARAGEWVSSAFRSGKVQLAGGSLSPSSVPAHRISAKARPDYPHLLLVNNKCLLEKFGADRFAGLRALNFEVQHKNSKSFDLEISALNVRYSGALSVNAMEAALAGEECVIGLTENPLVQTRSVDDPLFASQPALPAIAQLAGEKFFFHPLWGIRKDVVVAVVDSGTQLNHPDLASRLWRAADGSAGYDFVNGDKDPSDDFGHGTHVAGIILAQKDNGVGIRGVMGEWSRLMSVKSQDNTGGGTMADVINALRWAVDQGAEVVNLSLTSRQQNQALVDALDYAVAKNATVVVAAGNDGEEITPTNFVSPIGYAAGFPGVIGVGSIDANSRARSNFSNFGSQYVEVAAPGSPGNSNGILSTYPNGRYFGINGTSMAAPHVAGAAALVTGFLKTHSAVFTPGQVERMILGAADRNSANQNYFSEGRSLNIENLGRYLFNSTFVDSTGGFDD